MTLMYTNFTKMFRKLMYLHTKMDFQKSQHYRHTQKQMQRIEITTPHSRMVINKVYDLPQQVMPTAKLI